MTMNPLLRKTEKLLDKPEGAINLIDIDYKLIEDPDDKFTTSTRKTVEYNWEALLNSYRLWLQSTKGDYIRNSDMGGMFTYALNDKVAFTKENEQVVKDLLISETAKVFPDISIVECIVTCDTMNRDWNIKIVVQDTLTGAIFTEELNIDAEESSD